MSRLNLPKSHLVAGLLVLVVYLSLAWATALTERPGTDEGYFANPAFNLVSKGSFTTTVLETAGTSFVGMDRHTYWVMPLQPLVLSGWYKVFGFGVFSTRALSIFFGLVALVAWFIIVRSLFNQVFVAFVVVALLSCDYIFIVCAASGRMDMMSAALGFAGLAIYLRLRERRLTLAVLLSNALVVASGLTHPMGLLPFLGLIFLAVCFDRKRLGLKQVAVALVPYAVGGLGWGLYILQDPQTFLSQFGANASMGSDENIGGRFVGLFSPLTGLKLELTYRYLANFGLSGRATGAAKLKIAFLALYIVGVLGSLAIRQIRSQPNYKVLLGLTALYFLGLTFLDSQKAYYYLVHIVPFYLTMVALFLSWCWTRPGLATKFLVIVLSGICLLEIAGLLYRVRQDNYRNSFLPAVTFLKEKSAGGAAIAANSGVAFGLGFPENVVHDPRLGFYSGKRFDYIVIDPELRYSIDTSKYRDPKLYEHTMRLLETEYEQVYEHRSYAIYARR